MKLSWKNDADFIRDHGGWLIGDGPVVVTTENGARYSIDSEGWVAGGTRVLKIGKRNKLVGSVYYERGDLVLGCVMPGMRMEIHRLSRSMLITSKVAWWGPDTESPT